MITERDLGAQLAADPTIWLRIAPRLPSEEDLDRVAEEERIKQATEGNHAQIP